MNGILCDDCNDQSQYFLQFLRKASSQIKFFFLRFLQTKISKFLSEFWAYYFCMKITALGLKRSTRSKYCFICQGFDNSEIEVF